MSWWLFSKVSPVRSWMPMSAACPSCPNAAPEGEGIWFENFFANSFRTDRGEVAILSGFPAQTRMSIMKLRPRAVPALAGPFALRRRICHQLPYGGDLNFTDQASYMYATGWQQLRGRKTCASIPAGRLGL
ncbi:MAG: hypothetical protein ACLT1W_08705 [Alistipes onderdonkii]